MCEYYKIDYILSSELLRGSILMKKSVACETKGLLLCSKRRICEWNMLVLELIKRPPFLWLGALTYQV